MPRGIPLSGLLQQISKDSAARAPAQPPPAAQLRNGSLRSSQSLVRSTSSFPTIGRSLYIHWAAVPVVFKARWKLSEKLEFS